MNLPAPRRWEMDCCSSMVPSLRQPTNPCHSQVKYWELMRGYWLQAAYGSVTLESNHYVYSRALVQYFPRRQQ
jgi:hypothetical protein